MSRPSLRVSLLAVALVLVSAAAGAQTPTVRLTEGPQNNPAQFIGRSALDYPMIQVAVKNLSVTEAIEVRRLVFTASGTGSEVAAIAAGGVRLFHDLDADGEADLAGASPDVQLGASTVFAADDGTVTFDFAASPVEIAANATQNFVVIYTLNGSATVGQTFRLDLLATGDTTIVFKSNGLPVTMNAADFPVLGVPKSVGQGRLLINALAPATGQVQAFLPSFSHNNAIRLKIDNSADERVALASIRVEVTGTANDALVIKSGGLGFQVVTSDTALPNPASPSIGTGTISGDNGFAVISINPPLEIPRRAVLYTYVLLDTNFVKAEYFKTMQFRLPVGAVTANGLDSGVAGLEVVGENLTGGLWQYRGTSVETTLSSRDLGTAFASPGSTNYPVLAFGAKSEGTFESVVINSLTFKVSGSLNDVTEIERLDLWQDSGNREGRVDIAGAVGVTTPDVLLTESATFKFSQDDGTVTISGLNITAGTSNVRFLLTANISSIAEEGRTFRFEIPTATSIEGQGTVTLRDPVIKVVSSGVRTIQDNSATLVEDVGSSERDQRLALPRRGARVLAWNFNVLPGPNEPVLLRQVRIAMTKTWDEPGAIKSMRLGFDSNKDGLFTGSTEYLVGTIDENTAGAPLDQTGVVQLNFVAAGDIEFDPGSTKRLELWLELDGSTALWDESLTFAVTTMELRGSYSDLVVPVATLPFSIGPIPIQQPRANVTMSTAFTPNQTFLTCINNGFAEFTIFRVFPSASEDIRFTSALVTGASGNDPGFLDQYVQSVGAWRSTDASLDIGSNDIIIDDFFTARPFVAGSVLVDDFDPQVTNIAYTETATVHFGMYIELQSPTAVPIDGSVFFSADIAPGGLGGIGLDSGDPVLFLDSATGEPMDPSAVILSMSSGSVGGTLAPLTDKPVAPGSQDNEAWGLSGFFSPIEPVSLVRAEFKLVKSRPDLDLTQVFAPDAFQIGYNDKNAIITGVNGVIDYGAETVTFTDVAGPWYISPLNRLKIFADVLATAPEGDWVELHLLSADDLRFRGTCSLLDENTIPHNYTIEFPGVGRRMLFQTEGLRIELLEPDHDLPWVALPDRASNYQISRFRARTITDIETIALRNLTFRVSGTANLNQVLDPTAFVRLFDSATPLATGVYNPGNQTLTFSNLGLTIGTSGKSLYVVMTRNGNAAFDGQTIQFQFEQADVDAVGSLSGIPVRNYALDYDADPELEPGFPFPLPEIRLGPGRLFTQLRGSTPTEKFVVSDDVNVVTIPFTLKPDRSEQAQLEEMRVSLSGTLNDLTSVDGPVVRIYEDFNPLGAFNDTGAPDVLLGIGEILADDGEVRVRFNPPYTLLANTTRNFIAVVDLNGVGLDFEQFQHAFVGSTALSVRGLLSDDLLTPHYGTDKAVIDSQAQVSGPLVKVGKATIDVEVTTDLPQPNDQNPIFILPDADNVPMLSFDFDVLDIEDLIATGLKLKTSGSGDESGAVQPAGVRLWNDLDKDGVRDATDVLLGSGTFTTDNEDLVVTFDQSVSLVKKQTQQWLVTYDFGLGAVAGTTFNTAIDLLPATTVPRDDIYAGTGLFSQRPIGTIRSANSGNALAGPIYQISSGILEVKKGSNSPGSRDVLTTQPNVPLLQFTVEDIFDMETSRLTRVDVNIIPNAIDAGTIFAPGGVFLYRELTINGQLDAGVDELIATGSVNAAAQRIVFDLAAANATIPLGERYTYLVVGSFAAPPESTGSNFRLEMTGPSQFDGIGQASQIANVFRVPTLIASGTFTFGVSESTIARTSASPGATSGIDPRATNQPLLAFSVRPTSAADVRVDALRIAATGSLNEATAFVPGSIRLVRDVGTVGTFDPADTVIASGNFATDNGSVIFTPASSPTLTRNVTSTFLVIADFNGTAPEGPTMGISIPSANDIAVSVVGVGIPSTIKGTFPVASGPTPLVRTKLEVIPYVSQPTTFDVLANATNATLWQGAVTTSVTENVTLTTVDFQAGGTADDLGALAGATVRLGWDKNVNGVFDTGDTALGSVVLTGDNAAASITGVDLQLTANLTQHLVLYATLAGTGSIGQTFQYSVTGLAGTGVKTSLAADILGTPFVGPLVVINEPSFRFLPVGAESTAALAVNTEANHILQTLRVQASTADAITLQALTFELVEPGDASFLTAGTVKLINDINRSGRYDTGDAILLQGLNFAGGQLALSGLTLNLPKGADTFLLLVGDLNGSAAVGADIQTRIPAGTVTGISATGGGAAAVNGLPASGARRVFVDATQRLTAPLLADFGETVGLMRPALTWEVVNDPSMALSGSHYLRAFDGPILPENGDYAIEFVPGINASATPGVKEIGFWARYSFPSTAYRGRLQYSTNGGSSWTTTTSLVGASAAWDYFRFNYATAQNTATELRVRFLLDGGTGSSGEAFLEVDRVIYQLLPSCEIRDLGPAPGFSTTVVEGATGYRARVSIRNTRVDPLRVDQIAFRWQSPEGVNLAPFITSTLVTPPASNVITTNQEAAWIYQWDFNPALPADQVLVDAGMVGADTVSGATVFADAYTRGTYTLTIVRPASSILVR